MKYPIPEVMRVARHYEDQEHGRAVSNWDTNRCLRTTIEASNS